MEDGYSHTHTVHLINTSQRIMSGILQRELPCIYTNVSSIAFNPGVQHEETFISGKITTSAVMSRTNHDIQSCVLALPANTVISVSIP